MATRSVPGIRTIAGDQEAINVVSCEPSHSCRHQIPWMTPSRGCCHRVSSDSPSATITVSGPGGETGIGSVGGPDQDEAATVDGVSDIGRDEGKRRGTKESSAGGIV
jgi:hypothetical protein